MIKGATIFAFGAAAGLMVGGLTGLAFGFSLGERSQLVSSVGPRPAPSPQTGGEGA